MNKKYWPAVLTAVLITILVFSVYGQSLKGEFLWDDHNLVKENMLIRDLANAPAIFTGDFGRGSGVEYHFYRPVQIYVYTLGYSLWGLNPAGYHVINILLHILIGICVYWLVVRLFAGRLGAAIAGLLFVAHPVHVETIAYISNLGEVLAALFILLCFILYVKWLLENSTSSYFLMLVSFILALFSKESAVIICFLIPAYHYISGKRFRLLPFMPVVAILLFYLSFRTAVIGIGLPSAGGGVLSRFPMFFAALMNYIRLLFLPLGLHMEYGNPPVEGVLHIILMGVLVTVLLCYLIYKTRREHTIVAFAFSWFLISLLPFTNIFPLSFYMAEHYLYVPSIGYFILIGYTLSKLYNQRFFKAWAVIFFVIMIATYSILTLRQVRYWQEPVKFYKKTLFYEPDNPRIYHNLGDAYNEKGEYALAIGAYERALLLEPGHAGTLTNLGSAHYELGHEKQAIDYYNKALEIDPVYADAHNNFGALLYQKGNIKSAILSYQKAIESNPLFAKAYVNLGLAQFDLGRVEGAMSSYFKAIEIDPSNYEAYNNLGIVYYNLGDVNKALDNCKRALSIEPTYVKVNYNIGVIYNALGEQQNAIVKFKEVINLDPYHVDAYYNLAAVYMGMGRLYDAEAMFQKVIKIDPQPDVYNNLARIYLAMENYPLALEFYDKARALGLDDPALSGVLEQHRK